MAQDDTLVRLSPDAFFPKITVGMGRDDVDTMARHLQWKLIRRTKDVVTYRAGSNRPDGLGVSTYTITFNAEQILFVITSIVVPQRLAANLEQKIRGVRELYRQRADSTASEGLGTSYFSRTLDGRTLRSAWTMESPLSITTRSSPRRMILIAAVIIGALLLVSRFDQRDLKDCFRNWRAVKNRYLAMAAP